MNRNPTEHPVIDAIANRWSPYRFEPREVEDQKLLQAALGLQVHQMAGVNLSRVRLEFGIPDEFEPQTAIAIGYYGTSEPATDSDDAKLHQRDTGLRQRKPLSEQVFASAWGQKADFVD